jgi:hypothetical protein
MNTPRCKATEDAFYNVRMQTEALQAQELRTFHWIHPRRVRWLRGYHPKWNHSSQAVDGVSS